MQSFLEQLVIHLTEKYKDDISELCIVLPNRRAGLFLKTHFVKHLKNTFWAPEVMATEDFVALLAEVEIVDTTTLLFELYETVKAVNGSETESFDEFSKWGQILLNDFNEIDRYLVDAGQLFGNLKDIKELENWTLNAENLTEFQTKYLQFWKSLKEFYFNFQKRLLDKHEAYQGLAYKLVSADVEERVKKHPWKKIIFAGFNALNKAEEELIEKLLNAGRAEIIWDTDAYYINNLNQEAGRFIRKYNETGRFKKIKEQNIVVEENLLATEPKTITIIGAAKNVAQAKVAGNLVDTLKQENSGLENTALVLADENLLFPVLHSLPSDLTDINVTMGYPLKNTPVAGYFDLIFSLHENGMKFGKGKASYSFYHTDLIKLLSHPYTAILLTGDNSDASIRKVIQAIQTRNIVFAGFSMIESIFIEFEKEKEFEVLARLLNHWKSPADAIKCITSLIDQLKNAIINQREIQSENKASLELEYLFAFTKIIKRIHDLTIDYNTLINDIKTLRSIINQIVRGTTLPFYGEPLMGLQVMGMLETRTLDFENVILLSCNEDILPSGKTVNSFVPFELKRHFGLPTYSDKDAIFAYHFYRLLQRAKNIYLLYNTENDDFGSGEKSRYLTQLIYELPKVNPSVVIKEMLVNIPVKEEKHNHTIRIEKSADIIEKLKAKAEYGFSPSLLNRYRNCTLQFYFQAIAGLKEVDEVEETIGADTLGSSIHKVLQNFYTPFIGKKIVAEDIKKMKPQVEAATLAVFEEEYSKTEISFGKNLLTLKVALKFINNFLNEEIKNISSNEANSKPTMIKALEQELETNLTVGSQQIKIKGNADRIDSIGKLTRIIDYKTGLADTKELKFEEWDEIRTNTKLAKSFQLLMYALMYQKMNPALQEHLISGIITFRELSAGLKTVKVNQSEELNVDVLKEFEEQVKLLLSEIFNPEMAFEQTQAIENCEYCHFVGICNR